eukprot:CAMPEP_0204836322 /NCGR_PEP_ID=MMETSP1346-20131115/24797_1 /ASSEMBLY_ACC=CAM_ASM_000771 /TAXON_ID=215587 /ORGANISM="Aplanochytrium stocchinoi, Strain GSBS06" /LENGTH=332 /DNA_ID=CAMNT_0051970927 /DNA_START=159 /DNA_END=1154 /DNA_ORIENTATION=+
MAQQSSKKTNKKQIAPLPGDKFHLVNTEYSITLTKSGKDVDTYFMKRFLYTMWRISDALVVGIERGKNDGHLHLQTIARIRHPSELVRKLGSFIRNRMQLVNNSGYKLRVKVIENGSQQTFTQSGGYVQKDRNCPWFQLFTLNMAKTDLLLMQEEYQRVANHMGQESMLKVTRKNLVYHVYKSWDEYFNPLPVSPLEILTYMHLKGEATPAISMVTPGANQAFDLEKVNSFFAVLQGKKRKISAQDIANIYFGQHLKKTKKNTDKDDERAPDFTMVDFQRRLDEAEQFSQANGRIGLEPLAVGVDSRTHTKLDKTNWEEFLGFTELTQLANM